MRRRFKAVLDDLDSMISYGVNLSRSVELTAQWSKILFIGPLCPVMVDDLLAVVLVISVGLLVMSIVVSVISFMVWWFNVGMSSFWSGVVG